MHEAKTHFSKLIAAVESGEEIVVARAGKPILKLVKIDEQPAPPIVPGFARDDFAELVERWDELDADMNALFIDKDFTD